MINGLDVIQACIFEPKPYKHCKAPFSRASSLDLIILWSRLKTPSLISVSRFFDPGPRAQAQARSNSNWDKSSSAFQHKRSEIER